ncbi:MAG: hypothetical protein ACXV3F_08575, partial [Frankiaceae bacterium]
MAQLVRVLGSAVRPPDELHALLVLIAGFGGLSLNDALREAVQELVARAPTCPPSTGGSEDAAATPTPSAPAATAPSSPPTTCSTGTPPTRTCEPTGSCVDTHPNTAPAS